MPPPTDSQEHPAPERWVTASCPLNQVGGFEERRQGQTTHLRLWPASQSTLNWLEAWQGELGLHRPGLRLLELGSGTGWLGSSLAANLQNAGAIILTECEHAFDELAARCMIFAEDRRLPALCAEMLDWKHFAPSLLGHADCTVSQLPSGGHFDVVVGSDLCWNAETASLMPWMVRAVLDDGVRKGITPMVVYGHWNRSPAGLGRFLEGCETAGLAVRRCSGEGPCGSQNDGPTQPPSCMEPDKRPSSPACSSTCSDDDIDWTAEIFGSEEVPREPIFILFLLSLWNEGPESRCPGA